MNKILSILFALLFLVGILAACTGTSAPEVAAPVSTEMPVLEEIPEPEETLPSATGVTSANVQVRLATEALLSHFGSYDEFVEFDGGGHQRIAITTETRILDFSFVELKFDESSSSAIPFSLHYQEQLQPETPFVVTWAHQGTTPHRGILFTDEENQQRLFSIRQSDDGGTLVLDEIEIHAPTALPGTATTGILIDPERVWESITVSSGFSDDPHVLSAEAALQVFEILSTMEAEELLEPYPNQSQQSEPLFVISITFVDGGTEEILSTETGLDFFRFTGTYGPHGDRGYVGGESGVLFEILMAYL
ncbi:MAG: hypothetical protein FWD99_07640 [Oscillospiraceae bacterium]|nr:hypothetical protein [Oscillospiraceae bacterium]